MASPRERIASTYLVLSGLDYFADMMVVVTSVLLFGARGLDSAAIFALVATVWIVEGLLEVPTGLVADVYGRRVSVMVSLILRAAGFGALFFWTSPLAIVVGTLVSSVGGTFSSGALEAWAVDNLAAQGDRDLDRLFSKGRIAENVGLLLGTMCGAVAGGFDLAIPHLLAGIGNAAGLVVRAVMMKEYLPVHSGTASLSTRLVAALRATAQSARTTLRGDRILLVLIIGTGVLLAFRGIPGVQWTVYFEVLTGGSLIMLGVVRSLSSLLEVPVLAAAMHVLGRGRAARRGLIVGAACVAGVCLLLSALLPWAAAAMVAYIVYQLAIGVCMPGIRAALNERIEAKSRATVLSYVSLCYSVLTGVGLIVAGSQIDGLGNVGASWAIAAVGVMVVGSAVGLLAGIAPNAAPRGATR